MKQNKSYGNLWTRVASVVFLLALIVISCVEINSNSGTISFNLSQLPNCIPFILLYFLLEFWLFPSHVRKRKAGRFFLVSLILTIAISVFWTFCATPFLHHTHLNLMSGKVPFAHWISCFIICLVVLGFFTTINLPHLTVSLSGERQQMEIEKTKAELELLKYQLNPHFLMNTLNNIHALIEIDSATAQEAVRMLSKLMRFMYNENSHERIDIQKDMETMKTYFDLMRLRFIDTVDIQFNIPPTLPNLKIPPCIFVNLAENAFTHGVSYQNKAFVYFDLSIDDQWVCGKVRNSRPSQPTNVKSTGFGLDALRNRLEYLYEGRYEYNVQITDTEYIVELKIPIDDNLHCD